MASHYIQNDLERVEKAVFSLSASSNATYQYPEAKSRVVKYLQPARESKVASILGSGYMLQCVIELSRR